MRHHYLPCFYLSRWTTAEDGRLCEFSRPYKEVKPKRVFPAGTAFEEDLYVIPGLPDERRHALEKQFFGSIDQQAKDISDLMLQGQAILPSEPTGRSSWFSFLMSLRQRNPEAVAEHKVTARQFLDKSLQKLEADYRTLRGPTDPPTYAEFEARTRSTGRFEQAVTMALQDTITLRRSGTEVIRMRWFIYTAPPTGHRFLTSDRPLVMTNGLLVPDAHIALPISPRRLFVAVRNLRTIDKFSEMGNKVVDRVNDMVARAAVRFVYSTDDSSLRFVENRLGANFSKGQAA